MLSLSPTPYTGLGRDICHIEKNGMVVIEAEHFFNQVEGSDSAIYMIVQEPQPGDTVSGLVVKTSPHGVGQHNIEAPYLDYYFYIQEEGYYRFNPRFRRTGETSNVQFGGFINPYTPYSDEVYGGGWVGMNFQWVTAADFTNIFLPAGINHARLTTGNGGHYFDRFILRRDAYYSSGGTQVGPPASETMWI